MDVKDVAELAALVREKYSPEALAPVAEQPTRDESESEVHPDGWWVHELPSKDELQPWLSFRLIDAVAMGTTLVITFWWDDGTDDETIYLMPLDTRDVDLDMSSDIAVKMFLLHHMEFTLGGPRRGWEPRTILLAPSFAVVRPYTQG